MCSKKKLLRDKATIKKNVDHRRLWGGENSVFPFLNTSLLINNLCQNSTRWFEGLRMIMKERKILPSLKESESQKWSYFWEIFKKTPHEKQVMMFSATISDSARNICRKLSRKAEEIFVDDKKLTLHGLQQHFVVQFSFLPFFPLKIKAFFFSTGLLP